MSTTTNANVETVAVTGGSGLIGSAILAELNDRGYRTVNLDLERRDEEGRDDGNANARADEYRRTDLLDAGDTYGSLARCDADAVIHMGTIPNPLSHPGFRTYESNVMTTYHVLEAATELGLESVCLASSVNAMGYNFQDEPEIDYLPVDEDHPTTPRDPYALGKRVTEVTADGFARLEDGPRTISTLRFPAVRSAERVRTMGEDDRSLEAVRRGDSSVGGGPLFDYVHVADAASVARLAIEADFEGHETFWVCAADTNVEPPTETLLEAFFSDTEVRGEFSGHESLISTAKAREVLGWKPERSWRDHVD